MVKERVDLITCTGARPEAFARCEYYMKNQTAWSKFDIRWLVVDDYPDQRTKLNLAQTRVQGPKEWKPGYNTQRLNMNEAMEHITGDYILVIEDDDWYRNTYVEDMVNLLKLDTCPIVGEGNAKYYNILYRSWQEHRNFKHASLCQTGFTKEALPILDLAVNSGELYFDIAFWRIANEKGYTPFLFLNQNLCIGIKGMPGRFGIGVGHKPKDYIPDPDFKKLKELVQQDSEYYINLLKDKTLWKETML